VEAVALVTSEDSDWNPPDEYLAANVAETVRRIVLSYRTPDLAEQVWSKATSS
jgi:hypothetical protein